MARYLPNIIVLADTVPSADVLFQWGDKHVFEELLRSVFV
jgi:hypothetical protein